MIYDSMAKLKNYDEITKHRMALLFEYTNINKKAPSRKIKYKNQTIGWFLADAKSKITDISDELYTKLSINEYIKASIDNYLINREKKKATV